MISRKTTLTLAELYTKLFFTFHKGGANWSAYHTVNTEKLYDFLFKEEYEAWFCNAAREAHNSSNMRPLQDFIMKLHTGETQYNATQNWTWEQRIKLGQTYLQNLAEDILHYWYSQQSTKYPGDTTELVSKLVSQLELDGYIYRETRLIAEEEGVIDTEEEAGILKTLFTSLKLEHQTVAFHHLDLSEEDYIGKRWDDAISNSRKFLECVQQEIASQHYLQKYKAAIPNTIFEHPSEVREYLVREGLLESKEKEAIAKVYGLLSHTGSHPYIAQNDQARLMRHLALTFSQFVLLRYKGSIAKSKGE